MIDPAETHERGPRFEIPSRILGWSPPAHPVEAYYGGQWLGLSSQRPLRLSAHESVSDYMSEGQLLSPFNRLILTDDEQWHPLKFHHSVEFMEYAAQWLSGRELVPLLCRFFRFARLYDKYNPFFRVDIFTSGRDTTMVNYVVSPRRWSQNLKILNIEKRGRFAFGLFDPRTAQQMHRLRPCTQQLHTLVDSLEGYVLRGAMTEAEAWQEYQSTRETWQS